MIKGFFGIFFAALSFCFTMEAQSVAEARAGEEDFSIPTAEYYRLSPQRYYEYFQRNCEDLVRKANDSTRTSYERLQETFVANRDPLSASWEVVRTSVADLEHQNLILAVSMGKLADQEGVIKFLNLLGGYFQDPTRHQFKWDLLDRAVLALSSIAGDIHSMNCDRMERIVWALEIPQESFADLLIQRPSGISQRPPLSVATQNLLGWAKSISLKTEGRKTFVGSRELASYLMFSHRLVSQSLLPLDKNMLGNLYMLPKPQRDAIVNVLEGTEWRLYNSRIRSRSSQDLSRFFSFVDPSMYPGILYLQFIGKFLWPYMPHQVMTGAVSPERGVANEIHEYAEKTVAVPVSGSSGLHVQRGLEDAVFENIKNRLGGEKLIPFEVVVERLGKIAEFDRRMVFFDLSEGSDFQDQTSLVYSFLEKFYPDKVDLWKRQFVGESLEAYKGRRNATSCIKGIRQRIVTGLRTIDSQLDYLFTQSEGPMLMQLFSRQSFNPIGEPEKMAQYLGSLGVRHGMAAEEIIRRFHAGFAAKLQEYGLQEAVTFKEEGPIYAGALEEELKYEDSLLNQALKGIQTTELLQTPALAPVVIFQGTESRAAAAEEAPRATTVVSLETQRSPAPLSREEERKLRLARFEKK